MNIVVRTAGGHFVVRPDTTLERNSGDLYLPEDVTSLSYTPVLFARICKPGKAVGAAFASRYYDCVGYGILIYPDDYDDGSPEGYAAACCLDHTSYLTSPMYQSVVLGHEENVFRLLLDGKEVYSTSCGTVGMIEEAIVEATKRMYIRGVDIIAVELKSRSPLCMRDCGQVQVDASYCDNYLMDFKIIF